MSLEGKIILTHCVNIYKRLFEAACVSVSAIFASCDVHKGLAAEGCADPTI